MKTLLTLSLFLFTTSTFAFGPFGEGSLGLNSIARVSEGSRSESGFGTNLNGKAGLKFGPFLFGGDLNFSVINTDDSFFNKVEENSYGLMGGVDLVGFTRAYLTFYPYSAAKHDQGKYEGMGYKLGLAFYLPFLPIANIFLDYRNATYDKKKVGSTFLNTPDLEVESLILSFGVFFH